MIILDVAFDMIFSVKKGFWRESPNKVGISVCVFILCVALTQAYVPMADTKSFCQNITFKFETHNISDF